MKIEHQLELFYFQIDKALMCMNTISTFHIMVIVCQRVNVNVYSKI
jgi:hypothetical protein